jgi:hypothetical protein
MDAKDIAKLKKIIKICQENRLKRVKLGEFEVEFDGHALPKKLDATGIVPPKEQILPTSDDLLFWSVGGVPVPDDEAKAN